MLIRPIPWNTSNKGNKLDSERDICITAVQSLLGFTDQ